MPYQPPRWIIPTALIATAGTLVFEYARARRDSRDGGESAYLTNHLAGSHAAVSLLQHLRDEHSQPGLVRLVDRLEAEFLEDRNYLQRIMTALGVSPRSVKGPLGSSAGQFLGVAWRSRGPDALALLEALEVLSLGVLGKRGLWLALRHVELPPTVASPADLEMLEQRALDQWRQIEDQRLAAAAAVFSHGARPAFGQLRATGPMSNQDTSRRS